MIHRGTKGGGGITKIGDDCFIMAQAHVAHDCLIGNNVIMANAATLAGHVSVDPHGRPCRCGSRGCLDVETDALSLLDGAGRPAEPGVPVLEQATDEKDRTFAVTALTQCTVTAAKWSRVLGISPITVAFPGGSE